MTITRRQALAGAAALATTSREAFAMTSQDIIVTNARITTLDRTNPAAEAVAMRDGKFLAVGSEAEVRAAAQERRSSMPAAGAWFPA